MTDLYSALTVVLEHDMRTDDAENLLTAIRQLRGVLSVAGKVANIESHLAEQRARQELGEKLWRIIYPKD